MSLKVVVLFQLLVCVAFTVSQEEDYSEPEEDSSLEQFIHDVDIPDLDSSDCQFQVIKVCNKKFKNKFRQRKFSASGNTSKYSVYCDGLQTFINCLAKTSCTGPFIDNYSYVVLQHGMMDKRLLVCPKHNYDKLKKKVKAVTLKHKFIDDIGADHGSNCSTTVHRSCVENFTQNMETNTNMCQDVQKFLTCYEIKAKTCPSKIIQHFNHLCSKLGEQMLKANERHIGMMC